MRPRLLLALLGLTSAYATAASASHASRAPSVSVLSRRDDEVGRSGGSASASSTAGSSLTGLPTPRGKPQGAAHDPAVGMSSDSQPPPALEDYEDDSGDKPDAGPEQLQQQQQQEEELLGGQPLASRRGSGGDGGDGRSTAGSSSSSSGAGSSGGSRAASALLRGPWHGVSLGNVPFFPLRTAALGRLNHSEAELREIIKVAVRDLAAAGGNLLRVWFHIDGSMSPPAWALQQSQGKRQQQEQGQGQGLPQQSQQQGQEPQQELERPSAAAGAAGLRSVDPKCSNAEADSSCCCSSYGCGSSDDGSNGGCGAARRTSSGAVCGCGAGAVADLKWLLRLCHRSGVRVLLVLWSHDILAVRRDHPPPSRDRALHMLTTAAGTAAYTRNCLTPLVQHLATTAIGDEDDINGKGREPSGTATVAEEGAGSCCCSPCCGSGGGGGSSGSGPGTEPAAEQPADTLSAPATAFPALHDVDAGAGASNTSSRGGGWGPGLLSLVSNGTESLGVVAAPGVGSSQRGGVGRRKSSSLRHLLTESAGIAVGKGSDNSSSNGRTTHAAATIAAVAEGQEEGYQGSSSRGNSSDGHETAQGIRRASSVSLTRHSPPATATATAPPTSSLRPEFPFPSSHHRDQPPLAALPLLSASNLRQGDGSSSSSVAGHSSSRSGSRSTTSSIHTGGGGGGDGGGAAPTYSSVLLGYELLNEPEGMSWDLRLYHNYMYDMAWGQYQLEDPDWYGRQVARRGDYRTLQALKAFGGSSMFVKGRDDLRDYTGWHFVGGNRPLVVLGNRGSSLATPAASCISRGSLFDMGGGGAVASSGDGSSSCTSRQQQGGQQTADSTFYALEQAADAAAAASPRPWYLNASSSVKSGSSGTSGSGSSPGGSRLAADWEAAAAQVASCGRVSQPGDDTNRGQQPTAPPQPPASPPSPDPPRLWLNRLMYLDVIGHHNSELPYLLPLVTSCRLRTVDVSVQRLQRFVSRLAAAVHAADPRALVTVGSHSPPYCSDAQWLVGNISEFETRPRNLFSDAELRRAFVLRNGSLGRGWDAAGGGTLDFYAPHGYPYWGHDSITRLISPFHVPAQQYQLDKPALVGEFWDQVSDSESLTAKHWKDLWRKNGYMGGLGWAMLQLVEDPVDTGQAANAAGTGRTLAAARRIVDHEKRAVFLKFLQEMRANGM